MLHSENCMATFGLEKSVRQLIVVCVFDEMANGYTMIHSLYMFDISQVEPQLLRFCFCCCEPKTMPV